MLILSRRTIAVLAAFFGLLGVLGFAGRGRAAPDNNNVVQALRAGGIVIVVRHGATFPDQADADPLNFDNIAAQRNLNDKGKALAKAFGDALRRVRGSDRKGLYQQVQPSIRDRAHRGLQEYREDRRYYRGRSRGVAERE